MGMVINTNMSALNAQRNLGKTSDKMAIALQRLSTGLRINSAKDDAAGLAIVNRMNSQVRGLNQAVRNAGDGISLAQTAEGALQETTNILQRMRELAVQAANDSNTSGDRASIQLEIDQLVTEIDRIATATTFNNKKILDGSADEFSFHVGANANQTIGVELVNVKSSSLGKQAGIVQSEGSRVSLTNDEADAGGIGISDTSVTATSDVSITTGEVMVKVSGMSSVDVAQVKYGGNITNETVANLENVNSANYGTGIAKKIAERINFIREMEDEDTGAGITGTYLENVYASAKTTIKASDIATGDGQFTSVGGSDYSYVGAGSLTNGQFTINGVDIAPVTFEEKDATGTLTNAINAKSDITGVEGSINSDGELVLTADDGRDIILDTTTVTVTNYLFGASQTATDSYFDSVFSDLRITGAITISAQDSITFSGTELQDAGLTTLTDNNIQAVGTIANANVKTREGANILIDSVDSAITQVDDMRAKMGAAQNRFTSTIANLQNVAENIAASRSRVLDADFANETANLTKSQILQQAGIAMLSQANTLPQAVLSLLQ